MLKLAFGLMLIAVCGASTIQLLRVRTTKSVYTSQYTIHRKAYNWLQARAECRRCGGHLVTINDAAEHFFLTRALQRYKIRSAWTGLNDRAKEGTYRWDRYNSLGGYKRWCKGQPNNWRNSQDCVMLTGNSKCLNDRACLSRKFFICEVNVYKTLSVQTV
uniref:C-type lectin domain-containing protein n=1 Tax=Clytia hemisphaerica TaxID=252671 RepID=A0A7M5ULP7_9CNID